MEVPSDFGKHSSIVQIPRATFERDTARAFTSKEAVRRQVQIDAPRCILEVDGTRYTHGIPPLRSSLLPLCTQAVLGLPVELLHRSTSGVLERSPHTPLVIRLSSAGDLMVRKDLRVLLHNKVVPLRVLVVATNDNPKAGVYFFALKRTIHDETLEQQICDVLV